MVIFCLVFTEGIVSQPTSEASVQTSLEVLDSETSEEQGEDDKESSIGISSSFSYEVLPRKDVLSGATRFVGFFKLPAPDDISPPPKLA